MGDNTEHTDGSGLQVVESSRLKKTPQDHLWEFCSFLNSIFTSI